MRNSVELLFHISNYNTFVRFCQQFFEYLFEKRSARAVASSADGPERRRETRNPVDSVSSRSRREAARREQARRDNEKRPSRREQRAKAARRQSAGVGGARHEACGCADLEPRREQARRDNEKRPSRRDRRITNNLPPPYGGGRLISIHYLPHLM